MRQKTSESACQIDRKGIFTFKLLLQLGKTRLSQPITGFFVSVLVEKRH